MDFCLSSSTQSLQWDGMIESGIAQNALIGNPPNRFKRNVKELFESFQDSNPSAVSFFTEKVSTPLPMK
jgi:hypothetical protein